MRWVCDGEKDCRDNNRDEDPEMCNFTTVVPATEGPTGVITEALTTEEATEAFVTKEATDTSGTEEATTMQPGNIFGYDEKYEKHSASKYVM